jgi:hypothetical protein
VDTSYFAVVGAETAWPFPNGRKLQQFGDGTSKTITLIEVTGRKVNWMEPRDISLEEAVAIVTTASPSGHVHVYDRFLSTSYPQYSGRNVIYGDGHSTWMSQLRDADLARALFTAAGRELIPDEGRWDVLDDTPRYTKVVKWGKIWSLTLFTVLTLLPAFWIKRRSVFQGDAQGGETLAGEPAVELTSGA